MDGITLILICYIYLHFLRFISGHQRAERASPPEYTRTLLLLWNPFLRPNKVRRDLIFNKLPAIWRVWVVRPKRPLMLPHNVRLDTLRVVKITKIWRTIIHISSPDKGTSAYFISNNVDGHGFPIFYSICTLPIQSRDCYLVQVSVLSDSQHSHHRVAHFYNWGHLRRIQNSLWTTTNGLVPYCRFSYCRPEKILFLSSVLL